MAIQQFEYRRRKQHSFVSTVSAVAKRAVGGAGLVLASQAVYVGLTTPRLPPPPKSGHDFEQDGLLVELEEEYDCSKEQQQQQQQQQNHASIGDKTDENEIRVVLLGDSPVEGIGNETHGMALGGQTAAALMRTFHKPVRYWSLGKSGLTAEGVELEMVPLLKNTSKKYKIDLVIVSCGTNNVLRGQSALLFGKELDSLLDSVEECRLGYNVPVIFIGLLDFSYMPFLPFPLSSVAGWRSRALQNEMEDVVSRRSLRRMITIAHIPEVSKLLNDSDHPLLKDSDNSDIRDSIRDRDEREMLNLDDFFADDGFHPAGYGTLMLGNLLTQIYQEMIDE